jgi:hypothetical protein
MHVYSSIQFLDSTAKKPFNLYEEQSTINSLGNSKPNIGKAGCARLTNIGFYSGIF